MSTDKIYTATIAAVRAALPDRDSLKHLDIGSGSGELIRRLRQVRKGIHSSACDYTDSLMQVADQKVDLVDLNVSGLPYEDGRFDFVTATEVIEHLENPRAFIREINRVLRPGGFCVVSTPNVLNLNSRLRNLWFGFAQLFGPLSIDDRNAEGCSGHISPFSYFYMYHALREADFRDVSLSIDKYQRSGTAKLVFLYLPIKFNEMMIRRREVSKYRTINETNSEVVSRLNSREVLLGRTIIVSAQKTG